MNCRLCYKENILLTPVWAQHGLGAPKGDKGGGLLFWWFSADPRGGRSSNACLMLSLRRRFSEPIL